MPSLPIVPVSMGVTEPTTGSSAIRSPAVIGNDVENGPSAVSTPASPAGTDAAALVPAAVHGPPGRDGGRRTLSTKLPDVAPPLRKLQAVTVPVTDELTT